MKFKPGDVAVYPNHGVGEIERVEAKSLGQYTVRCYVMNIVSTGSKVFVPVESADNMGLRGLILKNEINEVYDCFKKRHPVLLKMNWNKRYRYLQEKMKTGEIRDVASVISDLYYLKNHKGLSYGEEQLLNGAEKILVSELSVVEGTSDTDIFTKIHKFC